MHRNRRYSELKQDPFILERMRFDRFRCLINESKALHPLHTSTPTQFANVNERGKRIESKIKYYQNAIFRQKLKNVLATKIADYTGWNLRKSHYTAEEIITRRYAAKLLEEYSEGDSKTGVLHPRRLHGMAFAVAEVLMVHFRAVHPRE